ncbi:hypothetical protein EYC80_011025 [Monilinia laxa]|uniref:Extracellular membrane protein CFEM domain-containing protein n=1 Tax=Monilinia laxa TaxID=61186 RepID=A0A5N6JNR0_MONLA|nr:hypothetical protein EYC80_011025 [Monilinia laxa]
MMYETLDDSKSALFPSLSVSENGNVTVEPPPTHIRILNLSCAQVCFQSFVEDNFPSSVCGETPTLNCLCENGSRSTYTVGEGAVQCIMSEASVGFCNGDDSSNDMVLKAYNMCDSDKSALPNTHSTLTATLVLQSGSSIVQIAPAATISSSGSVATTLRTTASAATSAATATATATPSSTTDSKSSTGVSQPASATSASSSPDKGNPVLSTAQIAGIVVAGVGGIILVVVIILLFACMRRKRQASRDSGYFPFQQEPSMSIKSQSHFGITNPMAPSPASVSTRGPTPIGPFSGARMPPRVPLTRRDQSSPDPFSRRNVTPEGIGLAMTSQSPRNNLLNPMGYTEEVFQRGPSPLLPERPTLTLQVPLQQNSSNIHTATYQQPSNVAGNNRQSMDTQFEDEDTCNTTVASDAPWNAAPYGFMSNEKVPQQPDPAYYQIPRLRGELSPNVTEKIINSYKNPSPESDYYVRPLNIQRNFSQPRRPENAMQPPVSRNHSLKDSLTASSSVSSAKSRPRRPPSVEVDRLNSLVQSNPSLRRVLRKSANNPAGPSDQNRASRASAGSMTSFETVDSINPEPQELAGDTNLSPVVESPSDSQHGIGKSPVKYPKIQGNYNSSRRHSRNRTRTSIVANFPAPPHISIESPTHPPAAHIGKPWQEAEIASQKIRMSSLGLSSGNYLSPGSQNSAIMIRKSSDFFNPNTLAPKSPPPPTPLPLPPNNRQRDISPGGMSSRAGKRNAPPPPLNLSSSSLNTQPSQNKWRVIPSTTTQNEQAISLASPHYRPQVLNGILKKDSAHSLKPTSNSEPEVSSIYSHQTRNPTFDPRLTQMTTMSDIRAQGQAPLSNTDSNSTPNADMSHNPPTSTKSDGSSQIISIDINDDNHGGLPKTPGWVPKLTPTRRGNDLFLNVQ